MHARVPFLTRKTCENSKSAWMLGFSLHGVSQFALEMVESGHVMPGPGDCCLPGLSLSARVNISLWADYTPVWPLICTSASPLGIS